MGQLFNAKTLVLLESIGTANRGDNKYELIMINGNTPAVRSLTSDRIYRLGWDEIIQDAIKNGIDEVEK